MDARVKVLEELVFQGLDLEKRIKDQERVVRALLQGDEDSGTESSGDEDSETGSSDYEDKHPEIIPTRML